ncbi:hypothetical protein M408DRAFT_148791 [Serendipita vermifera MAFF 305830]|uniref:Uncharacterized protein n=1 Tax=Serendipita vermifera MAFF 305830 TaxID=933852 RepID=A0A0C3A645_SERVB|nr:hypothetical protein M408DRAFT_148791 [Serendipita vermifera MAFF 305830]
MSGNTPTEFEIDTRHTFPPSSPTPTSLFSNFDLVSPAFDSTIANFTFGQFTNLSYRSKIALSPSDNNERAPFFIRCFHHPLRLPTPQFPAIRHVDNQSPHDDFLSVSHTVFFLYHQSNKYDSPPEKKRKYPLLTKPTPNRSIHIELPFDRHAYHSTLSVY